MDARVKQEADPCGCCCIGDSTLMLWVYRYNKDLASGHQRAMEKLMHEQAQVDEYLAQRKLDEVYEISALC